MYAGKNGNLLQESADNCHVLKIENPILSDLDLLKIKAMDRPGFKVAVVPILFYKSTPMDRVLEHLFVAVDKAYREGANILIVEADEFAERDTEIAVSFKLIDGPGSLLQKVPMGSRDTELVMKAEKAMDTLAFDRSTFTSGRITMTMENPFPDRTMTVHMIGATEENAALGFFKEADAVFLPGSSSADIGAVEDFPVVEDVVDGEAYLVTVAEGEGTAE